MPSPYNYAHLAGHYKVCFEQGVFSPLEVSAISTGIDQYWGAAFDYYGIDVWFSFSEGGTDCAISVFSDSNAQAAGAAAQAYLTPSGWFARIGISPAILGQYSEDALKALGAHEMGHLLDFQQVTGGCQPYTMLHEYAQWSSFKCGDLSAIVAEYGDQLGSDEYEVHVPISGTNCYYVYYGYDYYYFDDGWHYWDTVYFYHHQECI